MEKNIRAAWNKRKRFLILLSAFHLCLDAEAQNGSKYFTTLEINKPVRDLISSSGFSTPLQSFINITTVFMNGQDRLIRASSVSMNQYDLPDSTAPDITISQDEKNQYLNTTIKEVITYKDSVAYVISYLTQSFYSIRSFYLENGKWLNAGEDGKSSVENARNYIKSIAMSDMKKLRRFYEFAAPSANVTVLTEYLKKNSIAAVTFLLQQLQAHKLVIYGEIHQRKISWEFLRKCIQDKKFAVSSGTVVMELPSHKQHDIDIFLAKDTIDHNLLLDIFREAYFDGWYDKGMYDFILQVWNTNHKLGKGSKIKIVLADTPRPYKTFGTEDDIKKSDRNYNRDSFMAEIILKYFVSSKDKRNTLFIVGTGHVAKTLKSAGSILKQKMGSNCYTIFTHGPEASNWTKIPERLRHGVFDKAFYNVGSRPLGFNLKNSPHGKEPFDGLYYEAEGSFFDNYDGYVFLGPLDDEPNGEVLEDLFSPKFIQELDRRYSLLGKNLLKEWKLKELSKKDILNNLYTEHSKKRFPYLPGL